MAKENKYYFSHDYNARNDRKIASLVKDYKAAGYGIYWCTAEMMHEEGGSLDFDEITFAAIAKDLNETVEVIEAVLQACVAKYKLLQLVENRLVSNRVKENLSDSLSRKQRKIEAGRKGSIKSGESRRYDKAKNELPKQNEAVLQAQRSELEANEPKERKEYIYNNNNSAHEEKKTELPEPKPLPVMTKDDFVLFQSKMIQEIVFIEQVMMAKNITDKSTMLVWIKFFNMHIAGDEKINKDYADYKRHFKNWFMKQDTTKQPVNGKAQQPTHQPNYVTNEDLDKYRKKKVNV